MAVITGYHGRSWERRERGCAMAWVPICALICVLICTGRTGALERFGPAGLRDFSVFHRARLEAIE